MGRRRSTAKQHRTGQSRASTRGPGRFSGTKTSTRFGGPMGASRSSIRPVSDRRYKS